MFVVARRNPDLCSAGVAQTSYGIGRASGCMAPATFPSVSRNQSR